MLNHKLLTAPLALFLVALLFGCSTIAPAPPMPLKLAGITVEPQPLAELASLPRRETFVRLLESAATDQAARSLVRRGIAGTVERARPGDGGPAGQLMVIGSVRMAVALPAGVHGLTAARRKGTLAAARVQLMGAGGNVVAVREASVAWHDVRWLKGARYRRSRPIEEVLVEAARLAVDRAVEDLRDGLAAPPAHATMEGKSRQGDSLTGT